MTARRWRRGRVLAGPAAGAEVWCLLPRQLGARWREPVYRVNYVDTSTCELSFVRATDVELEQNNPAAERENPPIYVLPVDGIIPRRPPGGDRRILLDED